MLFIIISLHTISLHTIVLYSCRKICTIFWTSHFTDAKLFSKVENIIFLCWLRISLVWSLMVNRLHKHDLYQSKTSCIYIYMYMYKINYIIILLYYNYNKIEFNKTSCCLFGEISSKICRTFYFCKKEAIHKNSQEC